MTQCIKTAIFPVAGLGTRLLPATKSLPKELLPVYDRPLIQLAVDEALDAGIRHMVFVTHPAKSAIEHYLRHDPGLTDHLTEKGERHLAERIEGLLPHETVDIAFVNQDEPLGLGHAILCARDAVQDGPVAVILPDDLILAPQLALAQMTHGYEPGLAGHMVAALQVAGNETARYGIFDAEMPAPGRSVRVEGFVEKPDPADAPSTLAAIGRYILDPSIFDALARTQPGAGGEIQLTDAIAAGIDRPGVCAFRVSGARFDCGSHEGLHAAGVALRDQLARSSPERAA